MRTVLARLAILSMNYLALDTDYSFGVSGSALMDSLKASIIGGLDHADNMTLFGPSG